MPACRAASFAAGARRRLPAVDVFVPTYNEDADLLANTLAAAKGMDYPADKLTVWLLDDGGTDAEAQAPQAPRSAAPPERRHAELCRSSATTSASAT